MSTEIVTTDNLRGLPMAQREQQVTAYLEAARQRLAYAVEMTGPETVAAIKAEVATAAEATKQLNLSREIQQDAQEMVRRAEYALGKAIRKGQADGVILRKGQRADYADAGITRICDLSPDYYSNSDKNGAISQLSDGVDDSTFEAAITESRSEGNLSRANVIRKIRRNSPSPETRDDRAKKIATLAADGLSTRQIAPAVGIDEDTVTAIARDYGITIPADRIVKSTRRINHDEVLANIIATLEHLPSVLEVLDLNRITDREQIDSLVQSAKALSKAINVKIKESTHD